MDKLTELAGILLAAIGGGGVVKLFDRWATYQRDMYRTRSRTISTAYDKLVESFESRLKDLEESEKECNKRNVLLEKKIEEMEASEKKCIETNLQFQAKITSLEKQIKDIIERSPWRQP